MRRSKDPARERGIQALRVRTVTKARRTRSDVARRRAALDAIKKMHGDDAINPVTGKRAISIPCISTGDIAMDDLLTGHVDPDTMETVIGSGRGLPRGRIVEVFGPESNGKTTLTLFFIAGVQAQGYTAAFIDVEHALDLEYAQRLGVDLDTLLIAQPNSAEEALQIAQELVDRDAADLIVVDSVAALTPQAEIDGDVGDPVVGLHARLMGQALRKLTAKLSKKSSAIVMFVNQTRMKIGVMYGNPETTPGGKGLRFYASVRLDIRRVQAIKEKSVEVGIRSRVKAVKNKVAMPFRSVHVDIERGMGITRVHRKWKRSRK